MVRRRNIKLQQIETTKGKMDYLLLGVVLIFSVFGIIMVFDSSFGLLTNKFHFVGLQCLWVLIGLATLMVVSKYDYHKLSKLSLPLMVLCILLLISVLFVGEKANGAVRWIQLGPFQFQPSEIMKPVFVIYFASWFSKQKPELHTFKERIKYSFFNELIPFLILLIMITILIVLGKDLGTAIIIGVLALGMYFVQGDDLLSFINTIAAVAFIAILGIAAVVIEPYRIQRILNFSSYSKDPLAGGYQISQILIAIGSGGLFGKGFTQSIQKQRYLVETTAATDSIFAVIAEELGFIGSLILLLAYVFFFYRCIRIAIHCEDTLGKLIATGIVIWLSTQTLLNIAVNVNLVPLTGVPLPFISYGGSSTIVTLAAIGLVLNVSRYHGKQT